MPAFSREPGIPLARYLLFTSANLEKRSLFKELIVDYRQRTLKEDISCSGIGLHSGEMIRINIRPAPCDTGIRFVRTDLPGQPAVDARFSNVSDTTLATTIGANGCRVSTVEHLMAAFYGLGIDNAVVEIDGPEVPIMDGSSAPFVFLVKSAGIREQDDPKRFIVIKKTFKVDDGNRSICVYPSKELKISYTIDFQHPLLRNQEFELHFSGGDFVKKISKAKEGCLEFAHSIAKCTLPFSKL